MLFFKILIIFLSFHSDAETTKNVSVSPSAYNELRDLDVVDYGLFPACRGFLKTDGSPGPWGKELVAAMQRVGTQCFYEKADFSLLCPNFKKFSIKKKQQFYLFTFAAIAWEESDCLPKARAQGTNDIADGLFQLEYSQSARAEADRHFLCKPKESVANTQDIKYQMQCAAGIFSDYHCDKSDERWTRVGNGGYWQKLRKTNRIISKAVAKFPGCN